MSNLTSSYLVAPTQVDMDNSYTYAINKVMKEVCELPQFKGIYEWKEDPIVPYPCPFGLTCNSGTCVYTGDGCTAAANLSFFDCKRREVECYLPHSSTDNGKCYICDFQIEDERLKQGPDVAENEFGTFTTFCAPGDKKYLRKTNPEDDTDPENDTSTYVCQGATFNPDPYRMRTQTEMGESKSCADACKAYLWNGEPNCEVEEGYPDPGADGNCRCTCSVACENDDDCTGYGAGGACMLYEYLYDDKTKAFSTTEKTKAYKKCVDPGTPYLEYRKNFSLWTDVEGSSQCVQTIPEFRKWCEMPWVRPGSNPERNDLNVLQRIDLHPQVKRHPPFYYDTSTGQCFSTKTYCTSTVPDGGFQTNFGENIAYLGGIFTDCKNPSHNSAEIREGYDCCMPLGISVATFFTGKSFLLSLENVVTGEISFSEFWREFGGPLTPVVDGWLSEDALKMNIVLAKKDMIAPGVSLYEFEWHPDARLLYPHVIFPEGRRYGLLASEIQRVVPAEIGFTEYGHRKLVIDEGAWDRNPVYRKIAKALAFTELASRVQALTRTA